MKFKKIIILAILVFFFALGLVLFKNSEYKKPISDNRNLKEKFNYELNDELPKLSEDVHVYDWNLTWGYSGGEASYAIALDSLENIYIAGETNSIGAGGNDLSLIKYNKSKYQQWNVTWGGSGAEYCRDIVIDSQDNIYIVGYTNSFGVGGYDVCVVKYNKSGEQVWNRTWGSSINDIGYSATLDSNDNIYIAGEVWSSFGDFDICLLKYNSSGALKISKIWGGSYYDRGYAIALDSSNNIYITGSTESYAGGTENDLILVKFNSQGNYQWYSTWGQAISSKEYGYAITIDNNDNIYITGDENLNNGIDTNIVLLKYNDQGSRLWNREWGGINGDDTGYAVATDWQGNVYIAGETSDYGAGGQDMCIIQYDSSGTFQWYKTWGGTGNDVARSIVFDENYNFYLGGSTNSFGNGGNDICIVRFLQKNQNPPVLSSGSVSPSNSNQSILYNFSVIYTDLDNDSPISINLTINETIYSMGKVNFNDNDYVNGCKYQFLTYLLPAEYNYTFFFECRDSRFYNSTKIYNNLFVNGTNYDFPRLSNSIVIPGIGNNLTIYNFTTWYFDKDNNLPNYVNITLNTTVYPMIQVNPSDINAMDGIQFYYSTLLPFGYHKFQINCSDGKFTNSTNWIFSPFVNPFYNIGEIELFSPYNNNTLFTGIINFEWYSLDLYFGSVNYTIQISNSSDFSLILIEKNGISEKESITNVTLYFDQPTGKYFWRIRPTFNNFYGDWSNFSILNIIYNENAPNLIYGSIYPLTGDQFTEFNFTVIYSDFDNNPPQFVNVIINETSYLMQKRDPYDNNFVDGCLYQFLTYLSPSQNNYTYFFEADDYKYFNSTQLKNNLFVNNRNDYRPILVNPQVSPDIANIDNNFNFSVWYFDKDNNLPSYMNITINTTIYQMVQVNPLDINAMDGIQFYFSTSLYFGYYQFQINCSDGKFTNSTNWISQPEVNPFYHLRRNGIVLNEICKDGINRVTWIELYNFGPDRIMTGWKIKVYVDYNSGDTDYHVYSFPTGRVFRHNEIMVVARDLFSWFNNHIAIGLFDQSGTNIDWFEEDLYDWIRPAQVEWEKDTYIRIYSEASAHRKEDLDTNKASDWVTPYSGRSGGSLNPGQTGEGHYIDLSYPIENETKYLGEIDFTWSNLDSFYGNLNYTFQLSNCSDFSKIIIEIKDILQGSSLFTTISLFINLQTDQYYWRIRPTYGIFKGNWSINYSLNVIGNDRPPKLVNSKVTPNFGDQFDIFNFTVWYFDDDNSFPSYVNITINNTIYSMIQVNPFDTYAIDGIQYYFATLLDFGYYQFQMNCSDGIHTNETNWITGPEVTPLSKCGDIALLGPENFTTLFTGVINFTWSSLEIPIGDVNYTIQISNTPDFSIIIYTLEGINERETISNLTIYLDLPTDQYYWRVRATYEVFCGTWSNMFTFNLSRNLFNPYLMNGSVYPKVGDQLTEFFFTVGYFDEDNNPPTYVNLTINDTSYMMTKLDPLDMDFKDGCIYYYLIYLPFAMNNYTYFFSSSDGKYDNFTAVYHDLQRIESNNYIPRLMNPQVSPNPGNILTNFYFSVWYFDDDNSFPLYVNITINNDTYSMSQVNSLDNNALDGIQYYYMTSLSFGTHKFQINCSDGLFLNATDWILEPQVTYVPRNAYAVIIGIEDYPGFAYDLEYCEDDARAIYSFLISTCNYKEENIKLLLNSQATYYGILSAIANVRSKCNPEDIFFFYYSGHGGEDDPEIYNEFICPYNSLPDSPSNYIYDSQLDTWLDNMNCAEKYIILDSCRSGGFIFSDSGEFYMTSCSSSEDCYEDPELGHGVFTNYFLNAYAEGKDTNGDGVKSLEEYFPYVSSKTQQRSYELGYVHHPQKSDSIPGPTVLYPSFGSPSVKISGNELNYSFYLYGHGFIESLEMRLIYLGTIREEINLLYNSPSKTGFGFYSGTIYSEESYTISDFELIATISGREIVILRYSSIEIIESEDKADVGGGLKIEEVNSYIFVAIILTSIIGVSTIIAIALFLRKRSSTKKALLKPVDKKLIPLQVVETPKISEIPFSMRFCPYCKALVEINQNFCRFCGRPLKSNKQ